MITTITIHEDKLVLQQKLHHISSAIQSSKLAHFKFQVHLIPTKPQFINVFLIVVFITSYHLHITFH